MNAVDRHVQECPTRTIRLLQLGNLRLSENTRKSADAVWSEMKQPLTEYGGRVDYVAVCGNITADGRPANFNYAAGVLADLLQQTLRDPQSSNAPNRVIVVPGPQDIRQDTPAYRRRFQSFRETLFYSLFGDGRELPDCWRVGANDIDYRQLKDMTLVGARYWARKSERDIQSQQRLADKLNEKLAELESSRIAYAERTPTILVTAETPLLGKSGYKQCDQQLTQIFDQRLRIWLHLYGDGKLTHLPSEPFRYPHHSLGIGDYEGEGAAKCNLVEISWPYHRCRPKHQARPAPTDRSHRVMARSTHFVRHVSEPQCRIAVPRYFFVTARELNEKDDDKLLKDFFEMLEHELFATGQASRPPRKGVSLLFVPGSGLEFVYDKLCNRERLMHRSIRIFSQRFDQRPQEWQQNWQTLTSTVNRDIESDPTDVCRLVVICDSQFAKLTTAEREQRQDAVRQWLTDYEPIISSQRLKLIYLSYDPDGLIINDVHPITMQVGNDTATDELLNRFLFRIPLNPEQLRSYTGNTIGLTRNLLDQASALFEKHWPGETNVFTETPRELVQDVLRRKMLDTIMSHFFDWMHQRDSQIGKSLFLYIRRELMRQKASDSRVDLQQFIASHHPRVWNDSGELFVQQLCDLGYLQWEDQTHKSIQVRVLAPFLCEISYQLFLSHAGYDERLALALKEAITKCGLEMGHHVTVHSYKHKDWHGTTYRTTSEAVEKHLRDSSGIVFLHRGGQDMNQGLQKEIELWRDSGGVRSRPATLILTEANSGPSSDRYPDLDKLHPIYLEARNSEGAYERPHSEIAKEVLMYFHNHVVSGENLNWILRPIDREQEFFSSPPLTNT